MQTHLLRIFLLTLGLASLLALPGRAAETPVPPAPAVTATGSPAIALDWDSELIDSVKPSEAGKAVGGTTVASVKLVTDKQPENVYSLQAVALNRIALKKGDTLFFRFAARSLQPEVATGVTKLHVGFERNSSPWESSVGAEIGVGAQWERFDLPFTCMNDFAVGEAKLSFMFGYPAQIAEVADVQLVRYDPAIAVDSLPKTARHADPVPPGKLEQEISRISRLRKELAAVADPAPAKGRTLHVSQKAAAGGDGSAEKPFASIPAALAVVRPGDTVLVAAGEYREPAGVAIMTSGKPDAWIKIQAEPGPRARLVSSGWYGFGMTGGISYIQIEGFEVERVPDPTAAKGSKPIHGSGVAMAYATHHIRVLNNVVHGFGTGGIISLDCDYLHLEGNLVYDCAKTSPYGGSAISLCRAFDFDTGEGYHNVVRANVCHDNELKVTVAADSGGDGRTLTDGNGIIIDVFDRSRANPRKPHKEDRDGPLAPYHGRTLVENNLIYDNGGRGIHVFRSSNVDVVNNTTYMNQKSADIQAGEFTAIQASHVNFFNNLAYGRKEKRGNTQDGSTFVIWSHNLFHNVADVLVHDGIVEADPLFAAAALDASADGFRLKPGSPALGQGIAAVAPPADLTGAPRPAAGPVDLGAYQAAR